MEAEAVPIVADAYNEAVGIAVGVFLAALALLLLVRLAPLLLHAIMFLFFLGHPVLLQKNKNREDCDSQVQQPYFSSDHQQF